MRPPAIPAALLLWLVVPCLGGCFRSAAVDPAPAPDTDAQTDASSGRPSAGGNGGNGGNGGSGGTYDSYDSDPNADGQAGRGGEDDFVEPACPQPPEPQAPDNQCDLLDDQCGSGLGCYSYVEFPFEPCESERYGTHCVGAGVGEQGDNCDFGRCAPGFTCVNGVPGTRCTRNCPLDDPGACPSGLVCVPIDVANVGVCT